MSLQVRLQRFSESIFIFSCVIIIVNMFLREKKVRFTSYIILGFTSVDSNEDPTLFSVMRLDI